MFPSFSSSLTGTKDFIEVGNDIGRQLPNIRDGRDVHRSAIEAERAIFVEADIEVWNGAAGTVVDLVEIVDIVA